MAIDLVDEGRSVGMLRGIFDQENDLPMPCTEDLLARAEIALAELVRWLRRDEDRQQARAGRRLWDAAFFKGYQEGRAAVEAGPLQTGFVMPSQLLPSRAGLVCSFCRAAVAQEISGFDLDQEGVAQALGDMEMLDNMARELGADIPGHPCDSRNGSGTCACGCAIWREQGAFRSGPPSGLLRMGPASGRLKA